MKPFKTLDKTDKIPDIFFKIASIFSFLLVLLVFFQVVARYFFQFSPMALQELSWYVFSLIFLFSLATAYRQGIHVRVDVLSCRWSSQTRSLMEIAGILFFLTPMSLFIIYYGVQYAYDAFSFTNPKPVDHLSLRIWKNTESPGYRLLAPLERLLRITLLRGEISPNPGGLEARWLIKACIPLSFLLLQGVALKLLWQRVCKCSKKCGGKQSSQI